MNLEPIAIIGIGCRFPGANNPEAFWQLLRQGVDAITEIPGDRWDNTPFYDPDPQAPNKTNTRWGGFLDQVDQFDPPFFGIAPREAVTMDPQQRLMLEVAWEALEDAGQVPAQLAGSQTGVFIGIGTHDYSVMLWQQPMNNPYATTGTGNCIAANRISYTFDLRGPSVAIDTACSASLVAVHLACQSLWTGESTMALAGGVNVLLLPTAMVGFTKSGFMAPDGRCKTFDAQANGYVRSEGVGAVVLKPLSQAQADGDPIYAVIRGSAVNQDGRSNGLTAPNPQAQEAVLRQAYERAGISPGRVEYVEVHGTGTKLGDPMELKALGKVLAEGRLQSVSERESQNISEKELQNASGEKAQSVTQRESQRDSRTGSLNATQGQWQGDSQEDSQRDSEAGQSPLPGISQSGSGKEPQFTSPIPGIECCAVGSVKTNIGHTETAAGIASLIKVALALKHQELPPSLHFEQPNPYIDFEKLALRVQDRLEAWNSPYGSAIAGVSAFGFGGTNAHVVLESAPVQPRSQVQPSHSPTQHLFVLSAKSELSLRQLGQRYQDWWVQHPDVSLADLCFTALQGRSQFPHRLAIVTDSLADLNAKLQRFHSGEQSQTAQTICTGQVTSKRSPKLFFCFSDSIPAIDEETLSRLCPRFGEAIAHCREGLRSLQSTPNQTRGKTTAKSKRRSKPEPPDAVESFVGQYAIAQLWQSWGVFPAAVSGHGIGLYVAACVAGMLSLEEGLRLAQAATQPGMQSGMHSGNILAELAALAQERTPTLPLLSATTGKPLLHGEDWAIALTEQTGDPSSTLSGLIIDQQIRQQGYEVKVQIGDDNKVATSDTQNSDLWTRLLQQAGELFVQGIAINGHALYAAAPPHKISLPTYPFQRQRFWSEAAHLLSSPSDRPIYPLLGDRLNLADSPETRFQTQLSKAQDNTWAYFLDHQVFEQAILPAAAHVEMMLAAGQGQSSALGRSLQLTQFSLDRPLRLVEKQTLQIVLTPKGEAEFIVKLFSQKTTAGEADWILQASGQLILAAPEPCCTIGGIKALQLACPQAVTVADAYERLRSPGLHYGTRFQAIQQLWLGEGQAIAQLQLPQGLENESYLCHPVLLDAGLQAIAMLLQTELADREGGTDGDRLYLPVGCDSFQSYQPFPTHLWSHVQLRAESHGKLSGHDFSAVLRADVHWFDEADNLVAAMIGLQLRSTTRSRFQALNQSTPPIQPEISTALETDLRTEDETAVRTDWLYELSWRSQPLPPQTLITTAAATRWLILIDSLESGLELLQEWPVSFNADKRILVLPGDQFIAKKSHFQINPTEPNDFQRLMMAIAPEPSEIPWNILYLWGWQGESSPETSVEPADLSGSLTQIQQAQQQSCGGLLHLVQASDRLPLQRLWLITQATQTVDATPIQPTHAPLWGMAKALRLEYPQQSWISLDLQTADVSQLCQILSQEYLHLEQSAASGAIEDQIAYRGGDRFVARLTQRKSPPNQILELPPSAYQLRLKDYGTLDQLVLLPQVRRSPAPYEVEIEVTATGLNFRDVLNALGMLKEIAAERGLTASDMTFGGECAGRIAAVGTAVQGWEVGDRVLAAQAIGSLGSFVTVDARFVAKIPSFLSDVAAATLPIAFLTAQYGLHHLAQLQPGERVLIHAAAGGVGQAAIQIAQAKGAEIFATASPSKWDWLKAQGVQWVMNSRTLDFADEILSLTEGQGVNVVLNSLKGDFIPQSLRVLAAGGRFVEIGKIGTWSGDRIHTLRPDVQAFEFDLLELAEQQPEVITGLLQEMVEALQQGQLRPLPHQVFPVQESVQAFRHMAQAKHRGKVVLSHRPAQVIRPEGTYLVTGGWGALGLQVADWLVQQGAQNLVLVGRTLPNAAVTERLDRIAKQVNLQVIQTDISDPVQVAERFADLTFSGIFHAAGTLADGTLPRQDWQQFQQVMAAKVAGTWNLHRLTQHHPLDFFVCFSSAAALLGSPGQSNYAAANAFMDALMQHRRQLGFPGLSVNWGTWAGAGMADRLSPAEQTRLKQKGMDAIAPPQGLAVLKSLLEQNSSQMGVMAIDWLRFSSQPSAHRSSFWSEMLIQESIGGSPSPIQTSEGRNGDRSTTRLSVDSENYSETYSQLHSETHLRNHLGTYSEKYSEDYSGNHPRISSESSSEYSPEISSESSPENSLDLTSERSSRISPQLSPQISSAVNSAIAPKDFSPSTASSISTSPELPRGLSAAEYRAQLTQQICSQAAQILGFRSSEQIHPQQTFTDLGMDSLMSVELSNYVRTLLGSNAPLDLALDYPTVETLVDYLMEYFQPSIPASQSPVSASQKSDQSDQSIAIAPSTPSPVANSPFTPVTTLISQDTNGHHSATNGKNGNGTAAQKQIPPEYYQFERSPEYLHMQSYLAEVSQKGTPFFTVFEGTARDTIRYTNQEVINYASYNYLGMAGDPVVNAAAKAAIDLEGTSVSASRVVAGERLLHQQLEQAIAQFLNTEASIVYVGGHTTNTTTIGHLFGDRDLILYDALSHNSIRQGCLLSGATAVEFPHNDWRSLDLILSQQRHHYEKVLIAIEGIYSTDGDIAPLPEIIAVKQRHKAFLLVDEAHSIGVLGAQGRGIGEYFKVPASAVDLWMGTLSKSFASCGGYIAGQQAIVEYLKYTAPGFVFSVGMSPPNTAAALAALQQLQANPDRIARLRARSHLFLTLAQQNGLNTGTSQDTPIIPIIVGDAEKAIALSQRLLQRGINAQPMIYPSVPQNAARLRFFISCLHTEAQIQETVKQLVEVMK